LAQPPDHAVRTHAKFSPSKLNYLDPEVGGCHGYKNREGTSDAAEEGTRLHELMDAAIVEYLKDGRVHSLAATLRMRAIREKWDDSTMFPLQWCAAKLDPYLAKAPEVYNEQKVFIRSSSNEPLTSGHYDLLLVFGQTAAAMLSDFKFGYNPVEPAATNRQGLAYAVGVLQKNPGLSRVVSMFLQPATGGESFATFLRKDLAQHTATLTRIVRDAEILETLLEHEPVETYVDALTPGSACTYCARFAGCPAYLRQMKVAVQKTGQMVVPETLNVEAIDTPAKAAVAALWCDFLLDKLPEVKKRSLELAKGNGGAVEYVSESGEVVRYEIQQRKLDRVLGSAPDVMKAVSDLVAPDEVLCAAKLQLGALEAILVPAIQSQAAAEGEKITKKEATSRMEGILEAHGVLSRPDGAIDVLKRAKLSKEPKQISAKAGKQSKQN
jgi:hypothetical protein